MCCPEKGQDLFFVKRFISLFTSNARLEDWALIKPRGPSVICPPTLKIPSSSQIGQEHRSRTPWLGLYILKTLGIFNLPAGGKAGCGGGVLGGVCAVAGGEGG